MKKILDDEILQVVERYMLIPKNIEAATNWWCEKLRHPEIDVSEDELKEIRNATGWDCCCGQDSPFSDEVERAFRLAFLWEVERELDKMGSVELYSDFYPTGILDEICRDIGFTSNFAFPANTIMVITEDEVTVRQEDALEVLWKA